MSCKGSIESIVVDRPEPTAQQPQGMCLDKGYDYQEVRDILAEFGFIAHIRARGEEAQALKREAGFRARRWVVERAQSWLNRFRRIFVHWEKKPENYAACVTRVVPPANRPHAIRLDGRLSCIRILSAPRQSLAPESWQTPPQAIASVPL
jgi:transposase